MREALVTPAEVQEVTGKPDASPSDVQAGVYQSCAYGKAGVVVLVRSISKATFDKSAAANPGGAKPVPGIGQDAYSASGSLLVWKNGTKIAISVTSDGSGGLDQAEQLAKPAVAQFPPGQGEVSIASKVSAIITRAAAARSLAT